MALDLQEFHKSFYQEVLATAEAEAGWSEDAFFNRFCDYLVDAGELETADRAAYAPPKGMRIDGYGGDPASADGVLNLIIVDFNQSTEIESLTRTDMESIFKRLSNFMTSSLEATFRNSLEEANPVFGLADLIAQRWRSLSKVRLFLISNRLLSSRIDGRKAGSWDGVNVTYSVWDIARLHRFASANSEREEIHVDLEKDFGGSLPVLPAAMSDSGYQSYLTVVPAKVLAAIYDRWHVRLLEQNVRVFLQARGGVNQGIRNTLENKPAMFFAYNNGLTATAESVELREEGKGLHLASLENFQIVNGGQTTASIHAASRRKDIDLSKVFVQLKLSVVPKDQANEVVSDISRFANTQNKVNAADFFANHPFHVRIEQFSRRMFAPSPDGTFRESKWFYERARGQYQDARGLLSTDSQRTRFDLEYPKKQLFSKTDLAKFYNPWLGKPESVSRGSQKTFQDFADYIAQEWEKQQDAFNEVFFRHAIARAIVFKEAERVVGEQPWYKGGGIRSRVVPYAIAKLAHDAAEVGKAVDFEQIWRAQSISEAMKIALAVASESVHDVIVGETGEIPNPLEWAKKQACWNRVKHLKIDWPDGWFGALVSLGEASPARKDAIREQRMLNGIEAQIAVMNAGAAVWKSAIAWGETRSLLTPTESSIIKAATSPNGASEKQSIRALEILRKLHSDGFQEGQNIFVISDDGLRKQD